MPSHLEALPASLSAGSVSRTSLWAGRIISGLIVAFMIFDGSGKIMGAKAVIDGTARVGYSPDLLLPIGIAGLTCALLYAIPRTAILGAILLTGYLGGATATMVRMHDPLFLFPVVFGVLVWLGLYLRHTHVRRLIPLQDSAPEPLEISSGRRAA